jgi:uncharacterized protein YheU (UPF0270 family)
MVSSEYDSIKPWEAPTPPIEVPPEALSELAQASLIEAFILREGTDYGAAEVSHGAKINQVKKQIEKKQVKIIFDPDTESVTLLNEVDWVKLQKPKITTG